MRLIVEEQNEDDEEADDVELVTTAVRFVPRVKGARKFQLNN